MKHPAVDQPILLLVEDEPDTADLVALIMKERGFLVVHAADGQDAMDKIALMPPLRSCCWTFNYPMSTGSPF
jgi:ActR/RegA family two-component response regulator